MSNESFGACDKCIDKRPWKKHLHSRVTLFYLYWFHLNFKFFSPSNRRKNKILIWPILWLISYLYWNKICCLLCNFLTFLFCGRVSKVSSFYFTIFISTSWYIEQSHKQKVYKTYNYWKSDVYKGWYPSNHLFRIQKYIEKKPIT